MQKVLYYCDKCGKEITNSFRKISIEKDMELCDDCLADLSITVKSWFDLDKTVKPAKPIDFSLHRPNPEKKRQYHKKKLDLPKIGALRSAGWSYDKIAVEFSCSPQTIANHIDEALHAYREGLDDGMKRKEIEIDDEKRS